MNVIRKQKGDPSKEKVIKTFKIDTIMQLPAELYKAVRDFLLKLDFSARANRCEFYVTEEGNCIIEGLDEQEIEHLYISAYCSHITKCREEGIKYADCSYDDFIRECKKDMNYISKFLDREDYERYCYLTRDC